MISRAAAAAAIVSASLLAPADPPALPEARTWLAAAPVFAGRILVAGGLADPGALESARADAFLFDPGPPGRVVARLPLAGGPLGARAGLAAVPLPRGAALLVAGDLFGTVEVYRPDAGRYGAIERAAKLPGGARVDPAVVVAGDGSILVLGGLGSDRRPVAAADRLVVRGEDILAEALPPMAHRRASHAAVRLADGRVLVAGGVGRADTEILNPPARDGGSWRWSDGPRLPGVRDDLAGTLLRDGRVLLTGGQDARGRSRREAYLFDSRTGRIEETGPLSDARSDHVQLALPDGTVLVLGGEDDPGGGGPDRVLASVERYDPARGRFERLKDLLVPRDDAAAVLRVREGAAEVWLFGGVTQGDRPLAAIEKYEVKLRR